MKNRRSLVSAGAILAMFAGTACAGTVSYGSLADPGTYFGTGNSNTGWTIDTSSNGLELGLGALVRFIGPATQDESDYYVPDGATTYPGKTGSAWGFDFSVDTQAGGVGSAVVTDYTYQLTITDETTSATFSFDPSAIPDNALHGSTGFQNAEALSFNPGPLSYDINAADTYQLQLSATPVGGGAKESVTIDVTVTPEPQTWFLIGSGLLCVVAVRRRSLQQRA